MAMGRVIFVIFVLQSVSYGWKYPAWMQQWLILDIRSSNACLKSVLLCNILVQTHKWEESYKMSGTSYNCSLCEINLFICTKLHLHVDSSNNRSFCNFFFNYKLSVISCSLLPAFLLSNACFFIKYLAKFLSVTQKHNFPH